MARRDLARAEARFRLGAEHFRALGDAAGESTARTLLGRVFQMREEFDAASECYRAALALDQSRGNRFDEGVDVALLAQVAWLTGEYAHAERWARDALAIHRSEKDWRNIPSTLATLAHVAEETGHPWRARLLFLRARFAATHAASIFSRPARQRR